MRARNHSLSGRFTESKPATSLGAFGEEHRRMERQKAKRVMNREVLKKLGATDEQLDLPVAVRITQPIDTMPAGFIRGLTPEEAFAVVTEGRGRLVFFPKESAPPRWLFDAIANHVEARVKHGELAQVKWFDQIVADMTRAEGAENKETEEAIELQIAERLATLHERMESDVPKHLRRAKVPTDDGEGEQDPEPETLTNGEAVPDGLRGTLLKLTDDDALALIEATGEPEQLESWLDVETLAKAPRKVVVKALEARIDRLYEGGDDKGAGGAGGQSSPSPTAPGDAAGDSPPAPTPDMRTGSSPSSSAETPPATGDVTKVEPPKPMTKAEKKAAEAEAKKNR